MVLDCLLLFVGSFRLLCSSCPCHDPNIRLLGHYFPSSSSCHTSGNSPAFSYPTADWAYLESQHQAAIVRNHPSPWYLHFSLSPAPAHAVPSSPWQPSVYQSAPLRPCKVLLRTTVHLQSLHCLFPIHQLFFTS